MTRWASYRPLGSFRKSGFEPVTIRLPKEGKPYYRLASAAAIPLSAEVPVQLPPLQPPRYPSPAEITPAFSPRLLTR